MGSALPADGVRPVTQTDCMHDWAVGPSAWGYYGGDAFGDNDGHPAARSISEGNLLRGVLTFRRADTIPSSGYELQAALWMSQLRKSSQSVRHHLRSRLLRRNLRRDDALREEIRRRAKRTYPLKRVARRGLL